MDTTMERGLLGPPDPYNPPVGARLQILHVTPFYEPAWAYGGMARASSGLCRALARRGHAVTVATARFDREHAAEETLGGVRVCRLDGPGFLRRALVPWSRALRPLILGGAF